MKKAICFLLILTALLPLAACGKKDSWRTDATVEELSRAVEAYLDGSSLAAMTEDYLRGPMKLDTSLFADWVVKINAYGANIDEYGIFQAPDEAGAAAVRQAAEGYLQLRRDTWMEEYMPEEKPKLTQAVVETCGRYVIYLIVAEDVRQNMLDAFRATLKAG